MILYTIISRIIAIRLHPGFAREKATARAMQDTKPWDFFDSSLSFCLIKAS
jgi:hypothetical protein